MPKALKGEALDITLSFIRFDLCGWHRTSMAGFVTNQILFSDHPTLFPRLLPHIGVLSVVD